MVIFGIVVENNTIDLVGAAAEPAFVDVVKDRLDLGLRAGKVGHFANRDTQSAAKDAAEVSSGVSELVCLAIAVIEGDENAEIVLARHDLDGGTGELCCDLVKAAGTEALFGARNVESADGRVMGCLLSEVRDADKFLVGAAVVLGHRKRHCRGILVAFYARGLDAGAAGADSVLGNRR